MSSHMADYALRRERPPYENTAEPVSLGEGFHAEERAPGAQPFHWMSEHGCLTFDASASHRFLELGVASEFKNGSQELQISGLPTVTLLPGESLLSLDVPPGVSSLTLSVNKMYSADWHPSDPRPLSIRVRSAVMHSDPERHRHVSQQHANGIVNLAEMLSGRTHLASTPRSLGIDLYGACNVKPPCVYCEWDWNKSLEGEFVDTPFDLGTLNEWGAFFDNSSQLVNCSIGEPFMMKNIDELLDAFGDTGKVLELTCNGQILTDRNIQKLLGRPINLYISLDAATPATYEKLRNNRFESLVANVRRLINAKGGPGHLPNVYLVFMPMKVNAHELDEFITLCADLRADQLVLRPLNYSDKLELNWKRAGYSFEYQRELLPFEKLVWISGRAAELCRQLGVELSDQMDFGGAMGDAFHEQFEAGRLSAVKSVAKNDAVATPVEEPPATSSPSVDTAMTPVEATPAVAPPMSSLGGEQQPACTEPWKSLYILRRGVFPCCYGGAPLAPMNEYRTAWNSPVVQDIRRELARGRFHKYCLDSPACPIVRKVDNAGQLTFRDRLHFFTKKWSVRALWFWQWSAIRGRRIMTERGYVSAQIRKVFGR